MFPKYSYNRLTGEIQIQFLNRIFCRLYMVVDQHRIKLVFITHFVLSFFNTFIDGFFCISPPADQSFAEDFNGRNPYKNSKSFFLEIVFQIETTLHINIKNSAPLFEKMTIIRHERP